ncbi:MAG: T9SS type A sorting domain-containing protein [Chitinophagales bacterium]|nr:T9SS type A sorting domain-containing protein [Chitinophagales bacterium]
MKTQIQLRSTILILALSCFFQMVKAQAPSLQWQRCIGGSEDDENPYIVRGMLRLADGNLLTYGATASADGDFKKNKGGYDGCLVKMDQEGNILWTKTYGGSGDEIIFDVLETNKGGLIVAASTTSNDGDVSGNHGGYDIWMFRTNKAGKIQSQHCFGGSGDDDIPVLHKTNNGNLIISCGSNSNDGDVSGNHGDYDGWVFSIKQSNGVVQWSHCIGGSDYDDLSIGAFESNGYLFFGGESFSDDGDVTGFHGGTTDDGDLLVAKIALDGNLISAKCYGGSAGESPHELAKMADGNMVCTGFSSSHDGDLTGGANPDGNTFAIKINVVTDEVMWHYMSTFTDITAGFAVIPTADGGCVIPGAIAPDFAWETWDCWMVKLDVNGDTVWSKIVGGSNGDTFCDGIENPDGSLVIQATTSSNDGDVSGNHGGIADFWVVKFSNDEERISFAQESAVSDFKCYPNPLNTSTSVSFALPSSQNISLQIFDVNGRLIRTLASEVMSEGMHTLTWNARDENGSELSEAIYFLRMQTENEVRTIQISVAR